MKKVAFLFTVIVLNVLRTSAQDNSQPAPYKVPAEYRFDHKVVYQVQDENKAPETFTLYFTGNGAYMSMVVPENQKGDEDFMVMTNDGKMISFGKEEAPGGFGKERNVLKVIDMRSMFKGLGEDVSAMTKQLPKNDNADAGAGTGTATATGNDQSYNLDNFVKTGRTKNVFGYTAEEYSKHVSGMENGKEHSGTLYAWYAKVDFDPEMMFSMGLGNLASGQGYSAMQNSHKNNLLGMGIMRKDYLLTEMNYIEDGGKESGTPVKVLSIDKTDFSKSTAGYHIENYSGMNLSQMIRQGLEGK
jgi:hypothetical protein